MGAQQLSPASHLAGRRSHPNRVLFLHRHLIEFRNRED
jgi:hypothetical protein